MMFDTTEHPPGARFGSPGSGVRALLAALAVAGLLSLAASPAAAQRPPWVTGQSEPGDLAIELVTFGPGDAVPTWFGHTAIVVKDTERGVERLYNYGMFDFDGTVLVEFALGRLTLWVASQPVERTLKFYKFNDRWVWIQKLNLPPKARMEVADYLAWNVRPANREYLYHHYRDNCSTRPRDIIDRAVDGALKEATDEPSELTYRQLTRKYTYRYPVMEFLMNFLQSDVIDQPIREWDAMFLPRKLMNHVGDLRYERNGEMVDLVRKTVVYHESSRPEIPDRAPPHWPGALVLGLLLAAPAPWAAWRWRRADDPSRARAVFGGANALVGTTLGLLGLVLMLMMIGTDHDVTYWNENLWLSNPVMFAAAPVGVAAWRGWSRSVGWLRRCWTFLAITGTLGVLLKVLPSFDQQNYQSMALILPVTFAYCWAAWVAPDGGKAAAEG